MLETPIAFFIFNRPDLTARVFEEIAAQQPRRLLVVADGPRNEAERELCERARLVIKVDWDCELETNYSETNLGCKMRVSSGLNWVFSRVEEAIILEDDCLPHSSFFRFCKVMLSHYKDDERVMHIAGSSFIPDPSAEKSHYFSHYAQMWGWATWRQAWKHYDVAMTLWPEYRREKKLLLSSQERVYWSRKFDETSSGKMDTWDYQWQFDVFRNQGLVVTPKVNLISNIGFGKEATHTIDADSPLSKLNISQLEVLDFPENISRNVSADKKVFDLFFAPEIKSYSFSHRCMRRLKRTFKIVNKGVDEPRLK